MTNQKKVAKVGVAPPPRQARAVRTRDSLLDALERLLRTSAFEDIAVSDIARVAGVSVGSVYSHFADKDAFLTALLDLWRERVVARLREATQADIVAEYRGYGSLRAALNVIVSLGYKQVSKDAHIIRATQDRLRRHDSTEWKAWAALGAEAFETIAPIVDVFADEITHPDPETAKRMLNYFVNVSLADRLLFGDRAVFGAMALDEEGFIREVADMAYGYLVMPRPRKPRRSRRVSGSSRPVRP